MDNIEQLYRMYFKDVFLYLKVISKNEDIAEELTQETFFKVLKSIQKFRGECDICVWICQIAKIFIASLTGGIQKREYSGNVVTKVEVYESRISRLLHQILGTASSIEEERSLLFNVEKTSI